MVVGEELSVDNVVLGVFAFGWWASRVRFKVDLGWLDCQDEKYNKPHFLLGELMMLNQNQDFFKQ